MNLQAQNFFSLLRAFLHADPVQLTDPDWDEIYLLARKNNLAPAICDAALALPEFSAAPQPIRDKYLHTLIAQSGAQLLRTEAFFAVYQEFLNRGIHPLVLKGIVCCSLYPKPELRLSCDEDIWIPAESLPESDRILRNSGYTPAVACESVNIETVQALTYTGPSLTIELHIHPFGTSREILLKMNRLFEDAFATAMMVEIEGQTIYTLNETDHYLFLFAHLYKHFLGSGVGIRQIADLLLFGQKFHDRIDFNRVHKAVFSLGGTSFYRAVLAVGAEYLGFHGIRSRFPEKELTLLMDDLIESGCFGNETRAQQISSIYISVHNTAGKDRTRNLLSMIFPPFYGIAPRYRFLYRFPWLLPAAWIMRIAHLIRELLFENRRLIIDTVSRGRRRVKLFRKYRF